MRSCSEAVLPLLQDVIHTHGVRVRQAPCMGTCQACRGRVACRNSLLNAGTSGLHATSLYPDTSVIHPSWYGQAGMDTLLSTVPWSWPTGMHPRSAAANFGMCVNFVKRHKGRCTWQSNEPQAAAGAGIKQRRFPALSCAPRDQRKCECAAGSWGGSVARRHTEAQVTPREAHTYPA